MQDGGRFYERVVEEFIFGVEGMVDDERARTFGERAGHLEVAFDGDRFVDLQRGKSELRQGKKYHRKEECLRLQHQPILSLAASGVVSPVERVLLIFCLQ